MCMRIFFISSGCGFEFQNHLSDEDSNILAGLQSIGKKRTNFHFEKFMIRQDKRKELIPKIKEFRPDFILVFRGPFLPAHYVKSLRKMKIPVGIWVVDDPYRLKTHKELVQPYNLVITQDSNSVPFYQELGKTVIHLPLAVNPDKYRPMNVGEKYQSDICFVGSAFPIRIRYFDQLTPILLKNKTKIIGQWWEKLKNYSKLKKCILNNPIAPEEVIKYYNGAKIVLNVHRTNNDRKDNPKNIAAHTPNNRTYEIAACKAFQLTTWRTDLYQHFAEEEIASFHTLDELKEKIHYYLSHKEEREEMAAKAYQSVRRMHTYQKRIHDLLEYLEGHVHYKKNRG
ncbi:spore maturation protein CgeB [Croceifilum oryzae]|uniref:Spore maturation protein CgeB n=1 Tax=Croceifilum oryzae TaxID=1553429 RepID=A0AAJ1WQ11_9BACL|nr:glycosyltransferase [Croceifilum oryzae]MDQ0417057.1 spore maturation protein CgeB [Croceifilum oryzae]